MSYKYESELNIRIICYSKTGSRAYDEIRCETDPDTVRGIDGVSWSLEATNSFISPTLKFRVQASAKMAKDLTYAVHIDIALGGSQNFENFTLNKWNDANEFQSTSGSIRSYRYELEQNNYLHAIAKLTVTSPRDLQPTSSVITDIFNPDQTDFTIQIGDEKWQAHQYILSARSPVFRQMLANKDCDESKQSLMLIVDVSKDIFELFFHYLFTNRLPGLSMEQASEVLIVADKYDVQKLKMECDGIMIKLLKEDDPVHDIFQFAHTYNCSQELKQKSFNLVTSTILVGQTVRYELVNQPELVKRLVDEETESENSQDKINEAKTPKLE